MQRTVRVEVYRAPDGVDAPNVYFLDGVGSESPSGWSTGMGWGDPALRDRDRAERDEAHHHGVQRVLRAHHAAVEEAQGRRHQQHQRGGDEHPADVGVVHDDIE